MTTAKKLKYELQVAELIEQLNEVSNAEQKWKVGFDRSNKTLYILLAACLEIYNNIKGKPVEKEALIAIKAALVARGEILNNKTKILTLIVRYVFKTHSKRAFIYSRALGIAVKDQITSDNFAEWVADFGGIEEISSKGATQETLDKQAELATQVEVVKDMLHAQLKTPLAIVPKTPLLDVASTGEYTLLIGKTLANGETQVLNVIPDATSAMIDMAIKKIAQALINQPQLGVNDTQIDGYVDIEDHFKFRMTLPKGILIDIPEVDEDEYIDVSQKVMSSPESLFQY
jgi:hypothetical protein